MTDRSHSQTYDWSYSTIKLSKKMTVAGYLLGSANVYRVPLCSMSPAIQATPTRNERVRMAPTTTYRDLSHSSGSVTCCNHFSELRNESDVYSYSPRLS